MRRFSLALLLLASLCLVPSRAAAGDQPSSAPSEAIPSIAPVKRHASQHRSKR